MAPFQILVASYTEEVSTLLFDADEGSLKVRSTLKVGHHPSWITFHPNDRSVVFAVLEQSDGTVVALRFDEEGKGEVVSQVKSGGEDPCSVLATRGELFIANYSSGTLAFIPLENSDPFISTSSSDPRTLKLQLFGPGPNMSRQASSHPHQVVVVDDGYNELLVPDLGADNVRRYRKQDDGSWIWYGHFQYELGGGPRHVVYYNGELFTLLELSNKIVRHKYPPPSEYSPSPDLPKLITSIPTMSSPPPKPNDMLAAEILLAKPNSSFPTPYIYVSNRNDPSPEGDIVSIFDFTSGPNGQLELISEVRTGLKHVRAILLGGEDDRYLVAGGVNGGGVKVFERIDGGRGLKEVAKNEDIKSPTGFLWR